MDTFDVVIVGCGPTGATLANLLGALGCSVAVLERDPEVHPIPRATHIDEETLRNFQATGLMPRLLEHTCPFGHMQILDADGSPLLSEHIVEPDNPHGYRGSRFFDQPAFERILRDGLTRYPRVALTVGVTVVAVTDAGDHAVVTVQHADGRRQTLRAGFVVGCDGGRSSVRAALGVDMESLAPRRQWMIVDSRLLLRPPPVAQMVGNAQIPCHLGDRVAGLSAQAHRFFFQRLRIRLSCLRAHPVLRLHHSPPSGGVCEIGGRSSGG